MMKFSLPIFKKTSFYIECLLFTVIVCLFNFSFSSSLSRSLDTYKGFNGFESTSMVFDNVPERDNYFYDVSLNNYIYLEKDGKSILNSDLYQFIPGVKYDLISPINPSNIYKGNYRVLKQNEAAITKFVSERYNLSIGDTLYFGKTEIKIAFITNDYFEIYKIDYNSSHCVTFLGESTISEVRNSYVCFNLTRNAYSTEPKLINFRNKLKSSIVGLSTFLFVFSVFADFVISFFKYKKEIMYLHFLEMSSLNRYKVAFEIELFYFIFKVFLCFSSSLVFKLNTIHLIFFMASLLLSFIINLALIFIMSSNKRRTVDAKR